MTLTLLAVSLNEQPLSQPITACFDSNGGSIGRADHNTMALPDPERHISRLQAEVMASGARFIIKNVGAANPIVVGGRSLAQGESAPLADRDQVRIGGYLLQVMVEPDDDMPGADITRGRAAVAASTGQPSQPGQRGEFRMPHDFPPPRAEPPAVAPPPRTPGPSPVSGLGGFGAGTGMPPLSSDNPFADLMGSPPAPPMYGGARPPTPPNDTFSDLIAPAGVKAGSSALGSSAAPPAGAFLPADWDVFSRPAPPPPAPAAAPAGSNPFGDLIPNATPGRIDDLYGLPGGGGQAALDNFLSSPPAAGPAQPQARRTGPSTDPLAALFGDAPAATPPGASAPNHISDLHAAFPTPRAVAAPAAPRSGGALPPAPSVAPPMPNSRFDWSNPVPPTRAPQPIAPPMGRPPVMAPPPVMPAPRAAASDIDFEFTTTSGIRKPSPGAVFTGAPVPLGAQDFAPAARPPAGMPPAPGGYGPGPAAPAFGLPPAPSGMSLDPLAAFGGAPSSDPLAGFMAPAPGSAPAPWGPPPAFEVPPAHEPPQGYHQQAGYGQPAIPQGYQAPMPPPAPAWAPPVAGHGSAGQAGSAGYEALWAAFCHGAEIDPNLAVLDERLMHEIGQLLRSAVAGTLQMMSVRALAKQELGSAVTIIQQRNNNPLKFAPNATNGLEQLLQPTIRGFLSGPTAMTDAMHDLVGHTIGTVAGMRAALDGMLGRFAPEQLQSKLTGQSFLDSVLPMNRKAKLWELYLQHFESIREEAQEDFNSLFGKAFLAAYDQQLERLKQGGNPG